MLISTITLFLSYMSLSCSFLSRRRPLSAHALPLAAAAVAAYPWRTQPAVGRRAGVVCDEMMGARVVVGTTQPAPTRPPPTTCCLGARPLLWCTPRGRTRASTQPTCPDAPFFLDSSFSRPFVLMPPAATTTTTSPAAATRCAALPSLQRKTVLRVREAAAATTELSSLLAIVTHLLLVSGFTPNPCRPIPRMPTATGRQRTNSRSRFACYHHDASPSCQLTSA